jgi:hypothetical protein
LLLPPSSSYVEIDDDRIEVRMGWAFRSWFPRSAVVSTAPFNRRPLCRGVHGFAGWWLVNGSGDGILSIDLAPPPRAYMTGLPVRLR